MTINIWFHLSSKVLKTSILVNDKEVFFLYLNGGKRGGFENHLLVLKNPPSSTRIDSDRHTQSTTKRMAQLSLNHSTYFVAKVTGLTRILENGWYAC